MSKTDGIYFNKNGYIKVEELVRLVHTGELDSYLRAYDKNLERQCPPKELIKGRDVICMYCVGCFAHCINQIKDKKDHYLVKKVKYMKVDLDNIKESD